MKCDLCDGEHDEVYVHGRCHPTSPTWAVILGHSVRIECAQCQAPIVTLDLLGDP